MLWVVVEPLGGFADHLADARGAAERSVGLDAVPDDAKAGHVGKSLHQRLDVQRVETGLAHLGQLGHQVVEQVREWIFRHTPKTATQVPPHVHPSAAPA